MHVWYMCVVIMWLCGIEYACVWCVYSSMCGIFYGEDVVKYGEYMCTVCVLSCVYVVWYVYVGTEVATERKRNKDSVNQNMLEVPGLRIPESLPWFHVLETAEGSLSEG